MTTRGKITIKSEVAISGSADATGAVNYVLEGIAGDKPTSIKEGVMINGGVDLIPVSGYLTYRTTFKLDSPASVSFSHGEIEKGVVVGIRTTADADQSTPDGFGNDDDALKAVPCRLKIYNAAANSSVAWKLNGVVGDEATPIDDAVGTLKDGGLRELSINESDKTREYSNYTLVFSDLADCVIGIDGAGVAAEKGKTVDICTHLDVGGSRGKRSQSAAASASKGEEKPS